MVFSNGKHWIEVGENICIYDPEIPKLPFVVYWKDGSYTRYSAHQSTANNKLWMAEAAMFACYKSGIHQ